MPNTGVYVEKMSAFSRLLHMEGLCISPQETADACRILIEFGMGRRSGLL